MKVDGQAESRTAHRFASAFLDTAHRADAISAQSLRRKPYARCVRRSCAVSRRARERGALCLEPASPQSKPSFS
jgi:hypothetical protein